jgi:hypothetical protein
MQHILRDTAAEVLFFSSTLFDELTHTKGYRDNNTELLEH